MDLGYLNITVHTADDALPIADARVVIKNQNNIILYDTRTDENGSTGTFSLEAPNRELSLHPNNNNNRNDRDNNFNNSDPNGDPPEHPYSLYDVEIHKDGFVDEIVHGVEIFDGETSILPVDLEPLEQDQDYGEKHIHIPPPLAELEIEQRQTGSNRSALTQVIIPEYITVHMGVPTNAAARNVRVKFVDYVKNVVSSEIYPTWPHNSIVANVHVVVTFAINRVYTEWYRSRGFNFDITNSTAYDQYFVEGRNIYQNISEIVDGIFNVYARRFGFRNPFFTQFCSGTTATCNGLSQWGTVDLANRGFTPLQILHAYYPNDLELIASDNIQAITESYPGYALRVGMSGAPIQKMQNYLNRIRVNFPLIPIISNPNGFFGEDTANAVRVFQRTFNLTADGIIGRSTWNKIIFIYVGVIRLAELDSLGQREGIGMNPPTVVIREGSKGESVEELQFIINAIAPFYENIPTVIQDSSFGLGTKNAVMEFQRTFNLTPDGIVGPATWNKLYSVYNGIHENAPVPPQEQPSPELAPPYPGTSLRLGSQGLDVRLIQNYLNTIRIVYNNIPPLIVDGIFGQNTQNAVIAFQQQFLLEPDGIVGQITWDYIMQQFLLVTGNTSVSLEYPGTPLRVGSSGSAVRLMQSFLRDLRTVYPSIPLIAIDGIFGNATRQAVLEFQRLMGLTQDGIVGPVTWSYLVTERNKQI